MHPVEPVPRPAAGRRPARGRPLTAPQLELTHGDRRLVVPPGRPVTIGRDEAAGFQVVHPLVSRVHVELRPLPTGWELIDHSRNGVFVAGERLQQLRLSPGATPRLTLALGHGGPEVQVALRAVGADPGAPPVPMAAPLVPPGARPAGPAGPSPDDVGTDGPSRQGRLSAVHRLPSPAPSPAPSPSPEPAPTARISTAAPSGPAGSPGAPATRIRIGRETDNDVVVSDLLVSRHHAELRSDGAGGWELIDLGSRGGTYVDGRRIHRVPLRPGMLVGIGHALFHLDHAEGGVLVEREDAGAIAFRAADLVVRTPKGRTLLDRVGFALEEKSLLAVVGPSGAGKSTLLRALTGFRPADEGTVTYADRDLYADYDELRQRIGLVPQDDILHPQLTVRRALAYAARLRFPSDTTEAERDHRIDEVIGELGLTGQAEQRIDSLSGGQRKRTSVALELLTRPSLLFLDEPTSGLDPGLDKSVMHTLRGLADDGRTVVVVTHNVANLDVCDRLLLLAPSHEGRGGTVAYFGPPREALDYFGVADFADLFLLLERESGADWGERFRRSAVAERYIGTPPPTRAPGPYGVPAPTPAATPAPTAAPTAAPATPPRQQSAFAQFAVLARRYLAVIGADRQYTIFMVALPLLLAALSHALPVDTGLSLAEQLRGVPGAPQSLLMVFVVGAALMGSAASIRELVKEREIYRRERAIGLSRTAYLLSKVVVLGVITGLQGLVLGVLGTLGRPGPDEAVVLGDPRVEILVAIAATTIASMAVGLAVSAWIDNADRGMPLLVLLAMLQFILSSALLQIQDSPVLAQLSWLVPARWGFALGASTIGVRTGPGVPPPYTAAEPLWDHDAATWLFDLGALAGVTVLFVVVTALLLRRLDPRARRVG